eukprot:3021779-Prymnesium_polylepis.1
MSPALPWESAHDQADITRKKADASGDTLVEAVLRPRAAERAEIRDCVLTLTQKSWVKERC